MIARWRSEKKGSTIGGQSARHTKLSQATNWHPILLPKKKLFTSEFGTVIFQIEIASCNFTQRAITQLFDLVSRFRNHCSAHFQRRCGKKITYEIDGTG